MIHVNNLSVSTRLLPMSLQVKPGEVIHVIGPNGSGKTTFLSALAGITEAQGEVLYADLPSDEMSLAELARLRAYLTQQGMPAFSFPVYQYLSLSLPVYSSATAEEINLAIALLTELLQIADKLHRPIQQLSGGEWQRVRLAAICLQIWPALNPEAKLLILDEPAAPLDIGQEVLLYKLIKQIAGQGISVVMSNHDLNRSLKHADQVLLLDNGVVKGFGSANEVMTEQNLSQVFRTRVTRAEVNQQSVLLFE